MNHHQPNDHTGGYFAAQLSASRPPWLKPPAPFITIARQSCAGGSELAQLIAAQLNTDAPAEGRWSIFGGNIVNQMLQSHHLPEDLAEFLPEDRVSEVNATIGEIVGRHPSLWDLMEKTKETMRHLALHGHVILVGRGANFATAGIAGGVHLRLVARAEDRAKYYAQRFGVTEAEARVRNARCDSARRRFVQAHYQAPVDDSSAYDLVINTSLVPLPEAAQLVISHLRARASLAA
ncbi:MAG TPA: cytidylate kinase-like family protein [Lacunisphaera sp.]|nr:cytidylate kinase-like family protein [Lacunisphaera sp.]